jgi:hypothetical protein
VRRRWSAIRRRPLAAELAVVLPPWLVARALVALGWLVSAVAADELRGGDRPYHLEQGIYAWDGTFYRDIAEDGYGSLGPEALRFFPLVPVVGRWIGLALPVATGFGVVILSNVMAIVAGVLLHRLVVQETADRRLAGRAVWLLALLPPAMVLVLGYAESTFVALALGVFLALRRRAWWWAAGLGVLAGLTRPVGLFLVVPAAIEAWRGLRDVPRSAWIGRLAAVVAPAIGTACYLVWVEVEHGDWALPFSVQGQSDLRGAWVNPVGRALRSFDGLLGSEPLGDGLHFPWIVLYALLLVVVFLRWPIAYGAYSAVLLAVALSAESLGSFERYGMAAFPLVLALASLASMRTWTAATAVTACSGALVAFSALAFLGTFVP